MTMPRLSVGITTRNRPDALAACLDSLDVIRELAPDVLVIDDGSDARVAAPAAVRVIRDGSSPGYIVGRNRLVREARAPLVLLLDDDVRLLSEASVTRALAVLERDATVGAVAFAQAEADGRPWPVAMQPSRAEFAAVIPSFIGFAHLLRRDTFLALGGYRTQLQAKSAELHRTEAVRDRLRHHAKLLDPSRVDPDFGEELVRRSTGQVRPDEIIIPRN